MDAILKIDNNIIQRYTQEAVAVSSNKLPVKNDKVSSSPKKHELADENEKGKGKELADEAASEIQVATLAQTLEKTLNSSGTKVQFNVSTYKNDSAKITFKVIDESTGEVVREFPSDEVKRLADQAKQDLVSGILFNAHA